MVGRFHWKNSADSRIVGAIAKSLCKSSYSLVRVALDGQILTLFKEAVAIRISFMARKNSRADFVDICHRLEGSSRSKDTCLYPFLVLQLDKLATELGH